ncbi:MAG: replication initiator protein A, partial [Actinomycetota bacterium]|nr:replication initiator protein A [Actinomycetota bacterium]
MVDTIAEEFTGDSIALIAVEANLEIPPVFQMRKSKKGGHRRTAEARNEIVTPSGERLEQYWRFGVPEPYELPGPLDQDVWVAVQALVDRRGGMPLDGKVSFEIAELVEIMNKSKSGQLYEAIKHSLLLLSSMHIHAENAFYSQDTEELETRTFRLWDVKLSTSRNKKRATSSERNVLEFHEVLVRSFRANYLKGLDPEFYYSLDHTLSKRLYRLIDRKRHENLSWSSELERMKQMVPLAPSYKHNSKI